MSVLEIVLYSLLGLSVIIFTIIQVYKFKHPEKFKRKNKKDKEEDE